MYGYTADYFSESDDFTALEELGLLPDMTSPRVNYGDGTIRHLPLSVYVTPPWTSAPLGDVTASGRYSERSFRAGIGPGVPAIAIFFDPLWFEGDYADEVYFSPDTHLLCSYVGDLTVDWPPVQPPPPPPPRPPAPPPPLISAPDVCRNERPGYCFFYMPCYAYHGLNCTTTARNDCMLNNRSHGSCDQYVEKLKTNCPSCCSTPFSSTGYYTGGANTTVTCNSSSDDWDTLV